MVYRGRHWPEAQDGVLTIASFDSGATILQAKVPRADARFSNEDWPLVDESGSQGCQAGLLGGQLTRLANIRLYRKWLTSGFWQLVGVRWPYHVRFCLAGHFELG